MEEGGFVGRGLRWWLDNCGASDLRRFVVRSVGKSRRSRERCQGETCVPVYEARSPFEQVILGGRLRCGKVGSSDAGACLPFGYVWAPAALRGQACPQAFAITQYAAEALFVMGALAPLLPWSPTTAGN